MFYAKFEPRGFSNEFDVIAFPSRKIRDEFVSKVPRSRWSAHYSAWVGNEPNARAYIMSAAEAMAETRSERKRWVRDGWILDSMAAWAANQGRFIDSLDSDGFEIRESQLVEA